VSECPSIPKRFYLHSKNSTPILSQIIKLFPLRQRNSKTNTKQGHFTYPFQQKILKERDDEEEEDGEEEELDESKVEKKRKDDDEEVGEEKELERKQEKEDVKGRKRKKKDKLLAEKSINCKKGGWGLHLAGCVIKVPDVWINPPLPEDVFKKKKPPKRTGKK
jgi:hypothetical protein